MRCREGQQMILHASQEQENEKEKMCSNQIIFLFCPVFLFYIHIDLHVLIHVLTTERKPLASVNRTAFFYMRQKSDDNRLHEDLHPSL